VLPACDLQADMPQRLQLPTNLCETVRMLHCSARVNLCSGSGLVRRSDVRSGARLVCCSGSGHVRCSLCSQVCSGSDVRGTRLVRGSDVRSGSGDLRCSGSGDLRRSLCSQVRSGSDVRGTRLVRRSGSGQVLRHRVRETVLRRPLRSGTLDL
jgi:hypothetical protein